MKIAHRLALAAVSVCVMTAPSLGQSLLGPLEGTIDRQLLKGWEAGELDGWFVLRNKDGSESEQTLAVDAGALRSAARKVSVNVSISSEKANAAIGILVRNDANAATCVGEITAKATANLFCNINGEYIDIASVPNAAMLDGSDVLELVETPNGASFVVNGRAVGDIMKPDAFGSELGVMAYDKGTFGIADFAITEEGGASSSGSSSGSGLPPRGGKSGGAAAPAQTETAPTQNAPASSGSSDSKSRLEDIMGPLGSKIYDTSDPDGWKSALDDGWVVFINDSKLSSELYYTIPAGAPKGDRVTSLQVGILPPEGEKAADFGKSAVGILVENLDNRSSCLGEVTLGGDGVVLCFDENGKSREIGRLAGAAKADGTDTLQLVELADGAAFLLNGKMIAELPDRSALNADIGVLAYERGQFYVRDFTIKDDVSPNSGASSGSNSSGSTGVSSGASAAADASSSINAPMFGNDDARLIGAYLGVTNGIFMHEFGHALIGELQVPSTGPEEDAVDIFSALRVVEPTMYPSGDAEIDAIGREVALYSVLPWYYGGMLNSETGGDAPWQDEHTADLKRFRNTFCVIYGGNPGLYGDIAEQVGLDERTLSRCEEEFNRQNRAWRSILAPYTRIGPWHPDGQVPADTPGAKVTINFEKPTTPTAAFLVETFAEPLQGFATDLADTYVLPRDIAVTYKNCDEVNAWYDPDAGTITMCYELVETLIGMISDVEMGDATQRAKDGTTSEAPSAKQSQVSSDGPTLNETADYGIPPTNVLFPAPYRGPTPASHARAETLTTEGVVKFITDGGEWLLVDTSGAKETLPGAFAVVDAGRDGSLTDSFQRVVQSWLEDETKGNKDMPVIFFGSGMQDRSSYNAALRAGTAGWKTYWYRGGLEAWKANGLPLAAQSE